jgi:hypothetical protein
VFHLEASMSLASLFAAGIALGSRHRTVVALSNDDAFCMNPGMLMERQPALPNPKHFVVANCCYGSTNSCRCRFRNSSIMPPVATTPARCDANDPNLASAVGDRKPCGRPRPELPDW